MWLLFGGLAATVLTIDQLTKNWIISFLAPGESVDVIGDLVRLVHAQNNGGLFGLLRGQAVPFALVSLVVAGLIVAYHGRAGSNRYLSITLGLLLGGALGNLVDRLRIGYVVDFVDAGIGAYRWYTFNVADSAISFAILLLLAASIWPSVARRATVRA
jgi:signal peptidase II